MSGFYTVPKCILLFLIVIAAVPAVAQEVKDSPSGIYTRTFANQLLIYNGPEYTKFPEPYDGSPIFGDDLWNTGSVTYDGQEFRDIEIFYDIYLDVLVIEHFDMNGHPTFFTPDAKKITRFNMNGEEFITIPEKDRETYNISDGYYHVLHHGNISLYAKRKVSLYDEERDGKFLPTFKTEDKFFIKYDGAYYEARNKKVFRKIFREQRKEINQFARDNRLLFFTENRENSLYQLTTFIDGLIEQGE